MGSRLLLPELALGSVCGVTASTLHINLNRAHRSTSSTIGGDRYPLGEVGEYVLMATGSNDAVLARIVEVRLPERERLEVEKDSVASLHPVARAQMLGTTSLINHKISAGVDNFPRLGASVFSAPLWFLGTVGSCLDTSKACRMMALGHVIGSPEQQVSISAERLFGRHCAVLGATGGGKSNTVAKLVEQVIAEGGKAVLLDAVGEYEFAGDGVVSVKVGPSDGASGIPLRGFTESDFLALFNTSGAAQAPRFREALRSLRLAKLYEDKKFEDGDTLAPYYKDGAVVKVQKMHDQYEFLRRKYSPLIEGEICNVNVQLFEKQIINECIWPTDKNDPSKYGLPDSNSAGYCSSLLARISMMLNSVSTAWLFKETEHDLFKQIDAFLNDPSQYVLVISLEDISYDFNVREVVANTIGRWLLMRARAGGLSKKAVALFVDEAHQFLNKKLGDEFNSVPLDAFEIIAKEGRKYGLVTCIATQRPRDLPVGVVSQMGTLLVHRLTNDRDRELIEKACGDIDRSASAFLPTLKPGDALLVGVDFPIPMPLHIELPENPPKPLGKGFDLWGEGAARTP